MTYPKQITDSSAAWVRVSSMDGSITISSGVGTATSSGSAVVSTSNSGVSGVSGNLSLGTVGCNDGG